MLLTYGIALLTLALAFGTGLPFALLFLPRTLSRYTAHLAPWFGISYLTAASALCYWFEAPGIPSYALWLLVPPALLGAGIIFFRRSHYSCALSLWNREIAVALIPATIALILFCQTLLRAAPEPTCASHGNNDITGYATAADMLCLHARDQIPLGDARAMIDLNWSGPLFLTALVAFFSGHHAYEIATLVLGVVFVLGVVAFYPLCRQFLFSRLTSALLTLLFAITPLMQGILWNDFGGQIFGVGFALILAVAFAHFSRLARPSFLPHLPLFLVAIWGLLVSYAIMLPLAFGFAFVGGPAASVIGLYRKKKEAVRSILILLAFCGIALLFFLPRIAVAISSVETLASGSSQGWFVPMMKPSIWLGFTIPPSFAAIGISIGWIALFFLFLAFFIASLFTPFRASRIAIASLLFVLSYIILYIVLAFHGRHGEVWAGYQSYKMATFALPFLLIGIVGVFQSASSRIPLLRPLSIILAAVVIFASAVASFCMWKSIGSKLVLRKNLIELRQLAIFPIFDSIDISALTTWEQAWLVDILNNKKLILTSTDQEASPSPQSNWKLIRIASLPSSTKKMVEINREFGLLPSTLLDSTKQPPLPTLRPTH